MISKLFKGIIAKPNLEHWIKLHFWMPSSYPQDINDISKKETEKGMLWKKTAGHVSLQTSSQEYMSLWPKIEPGEPIRSKHDAYFAESPEEDASIKKRAADHVIALYTLDAQNIEREIQRLKIGEICFWQITGKNSFQGSKGQSCSGITQDLLNAGKFPKTLLWIGGLTYTTPSSILISTRMYKKIEEKAYPETKIVSPPSNKKNL